MTSFKFFSFLAGILIPGSATHSALVQLGLHTTVHKLATSSSSRCQSYPTKLMPWSSVISCILNCQNQCKQACLRWNKSWPRFTLLNLELSMKSSKLPSPDLNCYFNTMTPSSLSNLFRLLDKQVRRCSIFPKTMATWIMHICY